MATMEMREKLGTTGTSQFCDNVLSGTADLSSLDRTLQSIFEQLNNPPKVEISEEISFEDFTDAIHHWKEKTSTSPSKRHLGHYFSLLLKIGDETDELADTILRMHHKMLQIAQCRGRPYNRWKKEVEVMIKRDPGEPKIDRLRIICLYKADYNLYLKIMWAHRLVKIAKNENLFDDSQSGGRPNRTSGDVTLRKMLIFTYSRVTRTSLACMDLDAKTCYDRIIATFGMLCSRYFGMPSKACKLHGITIAEMQHHVKTAMGTSTAFFQSTPEKFLYGSGQGSSGSPPLWMTISIILFRALEARVRTKSTFLCPRSVISTSIVTQAFVDDISNFINDLLCDVKWTEDELSKRIANAKQRVGKNPQSVRRKTRTSEMPCAYYSLRLDQRRTYPTSQRETIVQNNDQGQRNQIKEQDKNSGPIGRS